MRVLYINISINISVIYTVDFKCIYPLFFIISQFTEQTEFKKIAKYYLKTYIK